MNETSSLRTPLREQHHAHAVPASSPTADAAPRTTGSRWVKAIPVCVAVVCLAILASLLAVPRWRNSVIAAVSARFSPATDTHGHDDEHVAPNESVPEKLEARTNMRGNTQTNTRASQHRQPARRQSTRRRITPGTRPRSLCH